MISPHSEKKTVLVTGGAGFIGSWVIKSLLERGDDVVCVDEMNDYYSVEQKEKNIEQIMFEYGRTRVKTYFGDICDGNLMDMIFKKHSIKWVCHLAARAGVRPSIEDPFIYIQSNVDGTTRLLELSRKYEVESFVFASSSSVYGGSKESVFKETDNVDFPVSQYAATKKSCELMAHTYNHLYGLNVSGLRFFTVFGPSGRPDMAPYKFIKSVATGGELLQFGDGSSSRDYTYVSDIVDGIIRSLDRPHGYQIYNLGNGDPVKLTEFINIVEQEVGLKAKIKVVGDQPGDVPRTCADISKAREMLGYNPSVSFQDGIRETVKWMKEFVFN